VSTIRLFFTNPKPAETGVTQFKAGEATLDDETQLLRVTVRLVDLMRAHAGMDAGSTEVVLVEMPVGGPQGALRHRNASDTKEAWDGVPADVRLAVIAACKTPNLANLMSAVRTLTSMTLEDQRRDHLSEAEIDDIP